MLVSQYRQNHLREQAHYVHPSHSLFYIQSGLGTPHCLRLPPPEPRTPLLAPLGHHYWSLPCAGRPPSRNSWWPYHEGVTSRIALLQTVVSDKLHGWKWLSCLHHQGTHHLWLKRFSCRCELKHLLWNRDWWRTVVNIVTNLQFP